MVPEDLLFWIAPLDGSERPDPALLCRRHADAIVVPRGWTLDDRREPVPRLFRPRDGSGDSAVRRRSRRRPADVTPPAGIAQQLDLAVSEGDPGRRSSEAAPARPDEPPEGRTDDRTDEPADEPTDEPASPWRPAFDTDDDLGGLLEVRSPLLARAFRGTGRRRG
jgi:hypothetical protein